MRNLEKALRALCRLDLGTIFLGLRHAMQLPDSSKTMVSDGARGKSRRRRVYVDVKLVLALFTTENVVKALRALSRGNVAVVAAAFRNLLAQSRAIAVAERELEEVVEIDRFNPIILQDGVPLVTVVIPCFNYGMFVEDAVASALAQTFSDLEVIVVDGGSTDGVTPDIVRRLAAPNVRSVIREGRHLAGSNRNFGISLSQSPYIVCLDADDTIHPTYLEKALFLAEHLAYDVVSTGLRLFGARSGTIGILQQPDLRDQLSGNHVYTCALFRRELWAAVGGYYDYGLGPDHAAEDWDLWIRIAARGARFGNISGEYLLNYRVHSTSSLSSGSGVPDLETQRQRIVTRNAHLINAAAIERSKIARDMKLQVSTPYTSLACRMRRRTQAGLARSILIVIPFFLVGGAERLLARVAAELVGRGWRVVVVSTEYQDLGPTDSIQWFEEVTREVFALPRFLHPTQWAAFIEYLFASRRFDAALIAGSRFFYRLMPGLVARYPELAIIDFLFNTVGHVEPHRKAMPLLTGVICENVEVREWCLEAGWSPLEVALVESRIDVGSYSAEPRPSDLVEHFGINPTDIVVGFSGRLSEEKAPEVFVEVAAMCRHEPRLRFIMTGGGRLTAEVERLISEVPASTNIVFCGVVEDVKKYFTLYDIFVLPSFIDGRPVAILEALASGCAVLASSVGGLPALVEDGVNGYLVEPGDAARIAEHLLALARDPLRLANLKSSARRSAEDRLDVRLDDAPYARAIEAAVERAQKRSQ